MDAETEAPEVRALSGGPGVPRPLGAVTCAYDTAALPAAALAATVPAATAPGGSGGVGVAALARCPVALTSLPAPVAVAPGVATAAALCAVSAVVECDARSLRAATPVGAALSPPAAFVCDCVWARDSAELGGRCGAGLSRPALRSSRSRSCSRSLARLTASAVLSATEESAAVACALALAAAAAAAVGVATLAPLAELTALEALAALAALAAVRPVLARDVRRAKIDATLRSECVPESRAPPASAPPPPPPIVAEPVAETGVKGPGLGGAVVTDAEAEAEAAAVVGDWGKYPK